MRKFSRDGSILITTLILCTALAMIGAGVFSLSQLSYKFTARNEVRSIEQTVAEAEMEHLYFEFIHEFLRVGTKVSDIPTALSSGCDVGTANDAAFIPSTNKEPYLSAHRADWEVRRSVVYEGQSYGALSGSTNTGYSDFLIFRVEIIPKSTGKYGGFTDVVTKLGRHVYATNSTIFQNVMFYQGDLELNPATDMLITGNIACNGSIYMGTSKSGGHTITATGTIAYKTYFNSDIDGNTIYNEYSGTGSSSTYNPPVDANTVNINSSSSCVSKLSEKQSFLGGLDADEIISLNPDLFSSSDPTENENNVYRSLILPPPGKASATEYPLSGVADDDTLATKRLYNKAATGGIIITVTGTTATITTNNISVTAPTSVVTGTTTIYDGRVYAAVALTTIDVGALKSWIATNYSGFNGVLYINMASNSTSTLAAARLANAITTPVGTDSNGYSGFTVVTNSGLYIQGDYNTGTGYAAPDYSTIASNPALLMADAVTLLSQGWLDASASTSATLDYDYNTMPHNVRVASANTTINASILTGNTLTVAGVGRSGGAQNLVSYLENWTDSGLSVYINGSVGCLFYSKYFHGFNINGKYYLAPVNRDIHFNQSSTQSPPPSGPTITTFSRGSLFNW